PGRPDLGRQDPGRQELGRAGWDDPPVPERSAPAAAAMQPDTDNPWGQLSLAAPARNPRPAAPAADPAAAPGAPAPGAAPGMDAFIQRFAQGAGVPAEVFAWRNPEDLAEELGALTRLAAENLKQLLAARTETKRAARAASHTTVQVLDNNPLKFTPTVEDALRIMFGRPTSGYLTARRAMEEGFRDVKSHEVKLFSAMQHALRLLLQDLDPEAVEASLGDERGLSALLGSRKARLWDLYATRWDALTAAHEDGMMAAFMVFFAECYDRGGKDR
ncbi:type VI secretion system-associated FHA domain protein TagH, partial [Methylobacterium crusticola]